MAQKLKALENAVTELQRLPAIGRKSARRIAYHLLRQPVAKVTRLAEAIQALHDQIRPCSRCFFLAEEPLCHICGDGERENVICVVEDVGDVMALEGTGEYNGYFHVLGGVLAPLDGIGPENLHIRELMDRLREAPPKEVIIATGFTVEGEATAIYLTRLIKPLGIKIFRLAYGLPVGSTLEHADEATMVRALEGKVEI